MYQGMREDQIAVQQYQNRKGKKTRIVDRHEKRNENGGERKTKSRQIEQVNWREDSVSQINLHSCQTGRNSCKLQKDEALEYQTGLKKNQIEVYYRKRFSSTTLHYCQIRN